MKRYSTYILVACIILAINSYIVIAADLEPITNFTLNDGAERASITYPDYQNVYLNIPIGRCVLNSNVTVTGILGSEMYPSPQININNDDFNEFGFGILDINTIIDGDIVWRNNWCDGKKCLDATARYNDFLNKCNANKDPLCSIPLGLSNMQENEDGTFVLSNLNLEIVESYSGVVIGGGVCDLEYVCDEVNEDECFMGTRSEVVLVNQRTNVMTNCDVLFPEEYIYKELFCKDREEGYISVQDSVTYAGMQFAIEFFELNPYNTMGAILYTVTAVKGQTGALTTDLASVEDRLTKTLALGTDAPCMTCGIHEAQKEFTYEEGIRRTMILLSDGRADRCANDVNLVSTSPSCGSLAAAQQAIEYSKVLNETKNITIYTIGFGTDPLESTLKEIALHTGGKYYAAEDYEELIAIYIEIARIVTGDCIANCGYQKEPTLPDPDPDNPEDAPCVEYPANTPVDLNKDVTYLDDRVITLHWEPFYVYNIETWNITPNNVLYLNLKEGENFGQIYLRVTDNEGRTDEVCMNFRQTTKDYTNTEDPFTRLQIAKGRLVSGYYEEELTGRVIEYGPYLITAQVWQK